MGYTNKTTHYELPQYVATDKPKYLTDFNETMVAIDTQMYANAQAAATADDKAVSAKDVADGAVASIAVLDAQINGDPTDPSDTGLAGEVSGIDTELNTVQSLIGSGSPTTSNQTIIGAINSIEASLAPAEDSATLGANYAEGEQFARGGKLYTALTALTSGTAFTSLVLNTDYKESDPLVKQLETGEIPVTVSADNVTYDNTTSGLTADDVQEALDEIVASLTTPEADDVAYDNTDSGLSATNVQDAIDELAQGSTGGLTKLWENSSPNQTFAAQTIQLSSSSYNFLRVFFLKDNSTDIMLSVDVIKGHGFLLTLAQATSTGARGVGRLCERTSDTEFSIANARISDGGTAASDDNSSLIPYAIYGY